MKNKFIIGVIVFVAVGIILCMGYILNGISESNNVVQGNNNIETQNLKDVEKNSNNTNQEKQIDNDEERKEEKFEKIQLNSKIGLQILENFNYYNINFFSDMLYDEIDSNGLSNKAKLIYTYLLVVSSDKYYDKFEYLDKYQTECISQKNIEEIAKDVFGDDTTLKHQDILSGSIYVSDEEAYQNIPMGFGGMNTEYSFDIPYEIKEYSDRVEVICNRLYLTAKFSVEENLEKAENKEEEKVGKDTVKNIEISDENTDNNEETSINNEKSYINVFSNRIRSTLLMKIEDEEFLSSSNQGEILAEYIENEKINSDSLSKIKYILEKEDDRYIITDIEK